MKKLLFSSLILLSIAFTGFSQTTPPPFINYQKVLFDVNAANPNAPLTNQSFVTFVNINDELGNLLYREEHYASTDANGLITVKMGDGLYTAGPITNFNQINWGVGKYYLVIDFTINGTISSTAPEQLVTVPYSFYAGKAGNGMSSVIDNGNGTLTFTYTNGATYITPILTGITGSQGPIGLTGAAGTSGANGLNALIETTVELAGANCANGGTKVETGLDANSNGLLDLGEVNAIQTKFICNGADMSTGVNSGSITNIEVFTTNGTFTVPNGVTRLMVEAWGAGGGGGGSCNPNAAGAVGGGGGSGAYIKKIITVIPGQLYSIVIGQGGNPGTSTFQNVFGQTASGTNGGSTSFDNLLVVAGGFGGGGANCSPFPYLGGSSGLPGTSNEIIRVNGTSGTSGCYYNTNSQTYCNNGKGGVNGATISGYLGISSIGKGGDASIIGVQGALIIYY